LAGFDVCVLAYDKYLGKGYAAAFDYVTEVDIKTLLKEVDIVSLHLPLTAETKHFLRAETLATCRDGVVIINTSRGSCINTADLLVALQQGKVAGACLDVFENEKTTTFTDVEREMYAQLYRMQQVVLTPHIAGWTHESKARLASILLDKIQKLHLTTSKL
jgi:D-3-phosphoglycerate dehydrogenase